MRRSLVWRGVIATCLALPFGILVPSTAQGQTKAYERGFGQSESAVSSKKSASADAEWDG